MRMVCARLVVYSFVDMVPLANGQQRLPELLRFLRDTSPLGKYLYAPCMLSGRVGSRCETRLRSHEGRDTQ